MSKTRRTITPEVLTQLKLIAERLPKVDVKTKDIKGVPQVQQIYGTQLIEQGIHTDKDGKKIVAGKKYFQSMGNAKVNHLAILKSLFIRGGDKMVTEYVTKINSGLEV
jgi:hypothetical protein